jgi:signal transduction histidine kinase
LATGVAHEINNPLAIIRESAGFIRLIMKREELAEVPRRKDFELALGKIEGAVDRAKRITHQLLGAARKDDSVLSEVDLKELVDEAIQLVYREAANKDIEVIRETDPALKNILSNPYQLRQVLINLLTNAIHATDSGGTITIALESVHHELVLTVRDTGMGIPKENLERIFEPFFTTKSPDKGTGLGLFVTRGIVEKLGGSVSVESRLGHGSSFHVRLPKGGKHKGPSGKDTRAGVSDGNQA